MAGKLEGFGIDLMIRDTRVKLTGEGLLFKVDSLSRVFHDLPDIIISLIVSLDIVRDFQSG